MSNSLITISDEHLSNLMCNLTTIIFAFTLNGCQRPHTWQHRGERSLCEFEKHWFNHFCKQCWTNVKLVVRSMEKTYKHQWDPFQSRRVQILSYRLRHDKVNAWKVLHASSDWLVTRYYVELVHHITVLAFLGVLFNKINITLSLDSSFSPPQHIDFRNCR